MAEQEAPEKIFLLRYKDKGVFSMAWFHEGESLDAIIRPFDTHPYIRASQVAEQLAEKDAEIERLQAGNQWLIDGAGCEFCERELGADEGVFAICIKCRTSQATELQKARDDVWDKAIEIVMDGSEQYRKEFKPDGSSFSVMKREVCFKLLRDLQAARTADKESKDAEIHSR